MGINRSGKQSTRRKSLGEHRKNGIWVSGGMLFLILPLMLLAIAFGFAAENRVAPTVGPDPSLRLTKEEIVFLQKHPVIRVSNEMDWMPYDYVEGGRAAGLSVDYLEMISQRLGIRFDYVSGYSWDDLLKMGYEKKLDVLHAIVKTPERSDRLLFTMPYSVQNTVFIVRKSSDPVQSFAELKNKVLSYPRGYSDYELIQRNFPELKISPVSSDAQGIAYVAEGKVDAHYANVLVADKIIREKGYTNITYYSSLDVLNPNNVYLRLAVRDDWPVLKSILEKAMASITFEEKEQLSKKWTEGLNLFYQPEDLTLAEKRWLRSHQILKVATYDGQPPLAYYDRLGVYSGIASEYLSEIQNRLGFEVVAQRYKSPEEAVDKVISGEADILLPMAADPVLESKLFFTQPIYALPFVIYGNERHPLVEDLYSVGKAKIAVQKGTALQHWLRRDYPEIDFVEVTSRLEAMKAIESGEDMVLIDEFLAANAMIAKQNFDRVRSVGNMDYQYEAAVAINKNLGELRGILRKTIQKIQQEKRNIIVQKWLARSVESGPDYRTFAKLSLLALLVVLVLSFRAIVVERLLRRISKQMAIIDHNVLTVETNQELEIERLSTALMRLLNLSEEVYQGKHLSSLFPSLGSFEPDETSDRRVAIQYATAEGEFHFEGDFSSEVKKKKLQGWILILRDVTALRRFEELSLKDGLTGVNNRRAYDLLVPRELKLALRNRQVLAYIILDLDNFKKYNDAYGHLAGDDALKMVASSLMSALRRPTDYVFRIGGEEFVIVTHHGSETEALGFADSIRKAIEDLKLVHEANQPWGIMTVSLGISLLTSAEGAGVEDLYRQADKALYEAKVHGRNRVQLYQMPQ